MHRRTFLKTTALQATAMASATWAARPARAGDDSPGGEARWKLGVCDWTIHQRGDLEAFDVAQQLGFGGIQLSFVPENAKYELREAATREQFLEKSKQSSVGIASLAMGILNQRPFATDPDAVAWVSDCIDVMAAMDTPRLLLAFFGQGDIKGSPERMKATAERLKELAPKAEEHNCVLGIESTLNAEEHMWILDRVGSDAVQVYYDVANMNRAGYDIYHEIQWLGKKGVICEMHMKEVGTRLGQGDVDFERVRQCIEKIDYRGWLVVEGAVPPGADWQEAQKANAAFIRETFDI